MREVLYIIGIFRSVLEEALSVQKELPEQILYLQPHKSHRIKKLAEKPPTPETPVTLLASTTDDLNTVQYTAEVVAWRDKRKLESRKKELLDDLIKTLQPEETGLYLKANGSECVNLLSIRNLRKLPEPFPIKEMVNARDGSTPGERTQPGGWMYIQPSSVPDRVFHHQ